MIERIDERRWAVAALAFGLLTFISYFWSIVFHIGPPPVTRCFFFAVGPGFAISIYALGQYLRLGRDTVSLQIGVMLGVVSGAVVSVMAVVQNVNFSVMQDWIAAAEGDSARAELTNIMWGVNNVQAALDIAWDIWISLGGLFLGVALMRQPGFGRAFGVAGIVVSAAALTLNLITYPTAPAEAGLIDLGPAVGLWYGALLIQLARLTTRAAGPGSSAAMSAE